jgi:hypothetical protein
MQDMPHIEAIQREIARLDSLAIDIDNEVAQLVDEMKMEQQQRTGLCIGSRRSAYYVYVFKPDLSQKVRRRKLAADYEAWFNAAYELVDAYLPKRATDFEYYYKHQIPGIGNSGVFYEMQFHQSCNNPNDKSAAAKTIQHQLDCQRNILNSIPGALKAKSMDLLTVISHDVVNSEIDCANYIFKKDKTHEYCLRVAGILAGIALERHLKTKCESELGSLPENPTLSPLIDALYGAKKITLNQKKYLEAIATTRNDCAHATASVNRTMVGEAISNVRKHLEGNL